MYVCYTYNSCRDKSLRIQTPIFLSVCKVLALLDHLLLMGFPEGLTTKQWGICHRTNANNWHQYAMCHDDVIKWKHFPRYWPFVRGIHRSPVNSPHKGQWRGVLVFSLIFAWIYGWVNNREAGDLRRHPSVTSDISLYTHLNKQLPVTVKVMMWRLSNVLFMV